MRIKKIKITDAIHRFTETDRFHGYSKNTRRQYLRVLTRLAEDNPGMTVDQLTTHHLERCLRDLRLGIGVPHNHIGRPGRTPGRSPQSLNLDKSILSVFCKYLLDNGHIVGNPARSIARTKMGEQRRFEDWVLTKEQSRQILIEAERRHRRDRMMVAIGLLAGLRDSEITGLQWADVNLRTRELDFWRDKQDHRYRAPINDELYAEFTSYYAWFNRNYGAVDPYWYVCPSRQPAPVRRHSMEPHWELRPTVRAYSYIKDVKVLLKAVGMKPQPNQGTHVLRRTFAFMLLDATKDIRDVMVALGHKNQSTTERYLFRNMEADRLVEQYGKEGFTLLGEVTAPVEENVVEMSQWRRRAG